MSYSVLELHTAVRRVTGNCNCNCSPVFGIDTMSASVAKLALTGLGG